uniref:ABC1 family protein n=1 Tax=Arundo donax TaxID=35708 RepID=A0A0A9GWQ7_ARUDO
MVCLWYNNLWKILFHHFSKVGTIFPFVYIIKFFKKSSSPLINQANDINGYLWKSPEYQPQVSNDE